MNFVPALGDCANNTCQTYLEALMSILLNSIELAFL